MDPKVLSHFGKAIPVAPSFQRATKFVGAPPRRPMLGQAFAQAVEEFRKRGPILPVQIGIPSSLAQQMQAQGQTPPPPEEIQALVDTGASITAINVSVAQRLGLPTTGSIQIGGATGVADQPLYAAMFRIPDPFIEWDPMTIAGANLSGTPFDILVGRNVLCNMTLSYDGKNGRFSLIL
jgi:predicted aspartyl protease